jgi:hypothetical protein
VAWLWWGFLPSQQWFKARTDSEGSLTARLTALAAAVVKLTAVVNPNALSTSRHDEALGENRRELDGIWKGESCLYVNCPMRPK